MKTEKPCKNSESEALHTEGVIFSLKILRNPYSLWHLCLSAFKYIDLRHH